MSHYVQKVQVTLVPQKLVCGSKTVLTLSFWWWFDWPFISVTSLLLIIYEIDKVVRFDLLYVLNPLSEIGACVFGD